MRTRKSAFLAGLAVLCFGAQAAAQDTTVSVLSIAVDLQEERDFREELITEFEALNPGVTVEMEYLQNEAFKAKLPTLLQSNARPDILFSFGGGVYAEQADAGVLQDIGEMTPSTCTENHSEAGLGAFTRDGMLNGLPMYAAEVVLWYNKALADQVGIDVAGIKTWSEFLDAVAQAKAAGVTPIIVGGKDKWPLHFYYSMLALRMLGAEGIAQAATGEDGGYASEGWVAVGREFERLIALDPFQPGFEDAGYEKAAALFGDSGGLFHLMGNWDYNTTKAVSTTGDGIADDNLGLTAFPTVEGGAGAPNDTFGGINGWVVTKDASQEAVDFLCFLVNRENQTKAGELGFWIPVAKGSAGGIANPFFKQVSENLAASGHHQLFLDQALGAAVGSTINDVSADLAAGVITAQEAAERIEEARLFQ